MAELFVTPKQFQPTDLGGIGVGYKAYFYETGTVTPKNTYSDEALSTANANPIVADSEGKFPIAFLKTSDGLYTVKVTDADDALVYTLDDYGSSLVSDLASSATGLGAELVAKLTVDTNAALTALAKPSAAIRVHVRRRSTSNAIGDGSGGDWVWDSASTATANGGTILAADAGGTGRWLRDYSGAVYPEWFGALGDGTTADTSAIQAAIDSTKNVVFSEKTFVSGALTLANAGQVLSGLGEKSIIEANDATTNLFTVQAGYIQINNMRLNGAAVDNTTTHYAVFTASANPASECAFDRLIISGKSSSVGFNSGFKLDDSCNKNSVSRVSIDSLWGEISGTGYGVIVGNAKECEVVRCRMYGAAGRGRHGVYFSAGASDCLASENIIELFNEEGITQFSTGAQSSCARNKIIANTVKTCCVNGTSAGGAIGIYGHSTDALVALNTVSASGAKGITIDGTGVTDLIRTQITGNKVTFSSTFGIDLISAVGFSLTDNYVHESSNASAGVSTNIRLISDGTTATSDGVISGNKSTGPTKARSALQFNATSPTPTNLKIHGNKFDTCVSEDIQFNGVTAAIDGRIRFSQTGQSYGPIADGASHVVSGGYSVPGAVAGDLVVVSHTSNSDGCVLSGYVSSAGTVGVSVLNLSGGSKTITSGKVVIDVWQRTP